jgi:hypothetical protein
MENSWAINGNYMFKKNTNYHELSRIIIKIKTIMDNEKNYVWVFTGEQAWNGEYADIIVHAFPTEDAAVKYMHDFLLDDGGDESIRDYVKRKEWEVEIDEPMLYRAFKQGYYGTDHIELTITKCVIEK